MKKTEENLISYLQEKLAEKNILDIGNSLAHEMVSDGWVELDKPRSYWIAIYNGEPVDVWSKKPEAEYFSKNRSNIEIIYTREVI